MRAFLFLNDLCGGGAQLGLAKALSWGFLKDDEVTVLTMIRGDGRAESAFKALPNVTLINLFPQAKLSPAHLIWVFFLYPYWLFRTRPQVIFLSLAQANLIGRIWGHVWPAKHVTIEHNTRFRHGIFSRLLPLLSWPVTMVLSDTQATLDTMAPSYPFRKNIQKLLLPLYMLEGKPIPKPAKPSGPFHIISAGRLMPVKNFDAAIRALALLVKQGHDIRYTIFGDGEERTTLESLILQERLTQHVILAGFNANWQQQLPKASLYLQPSHYEGLCITVLEAMQAGVPVAASPVGGLLDYGIPHQTYEPLLPPKPETIAGVIATLIADPQHAQNLATAAQKAVAEHFSPKATQNHYQTIHDALEGSIR